MNRFIAILFLVISLSESLDVQQASQPPVAPRRIAIVGGGPAGLTLANALLSTRRAPSRPANDDVVVFDRFDQLRPAAGGGIQVNGGWQAHEAILFTELRNLPLVTRTSRRGHIG